MNSWRSFFVKFSCVFVTYPYVVLRQMWYLIVLIHNICLFSYLSSHSNVMNAPKGMGLTLDIFEECYLL